MRIIPEATWFCSTSFAKFWRDLDRKHACVKGFQKHTYYFPILQVIKHIMIL